MQMRADRAEPVGQGPLDRTPVVGQQEVWPFLAQDAAEGPEVAEAETTALAPGDRAQAQRHVAIDERGTVVIAVATDHDMREPLPERIGDHREASLSAAHGQGRKGVQQLERTARAV